MGRPMTFTDAEILNAADTYHILNEGDAFLAGVRCGLERATRIADALTRVPLNSYWAFDPHLSDYGNGVSHCRYHIALNIQSLLPKEEL